MRGVWLLVNESFRFIRHIIRGFLKAPGFSFLVVLTLAIGIGATAAVLNLVKGVLLTPPPYPKPDDIIVVSPVRIDGLPYTQGCAKAQWVEWQTEAKSFSTIAGYNWGFDFLILPDGSESLEGMWVTPEYFSVIGIKPFLGRSFFRSEASAKPDPVIILGYELWQRRFNGATNIIGQVLHFSRRPPQTVIGVMPPGLRFLPSARNAAEPNYDAHAPVDFWAPASPEETAPKQTIWSVAGRLRAGVKIKRAEAELTAIAARQAQVDHDFDGLTVKAEPLLDELNREGHRLLRPLLGAVMLLFLIACANVAGLLLTRGLQKQQEYAVRGALGAQRGRLFSQALGESMLLALFGGIFGSSFALGAIRVLKAIGGRAIPRLDDVTIGWPLLIFCFGLAGLSTILAGLIPALRVSLLDPVKALKAGGPSTSASRNERQFLGGVVVAQTALTVILLVGAGLLIRTVRNITQIHPGFETEGILTMSVTMPTSDQQEVRDFHLRALERVSALPAVQKAAFAWGVPLTGNKWMQRVQLEGDSSTNRFRDWLDIATRSVTPEYFETMGIQILEGRNFPPPETKDPPFRVTINRALADRYFPKLNPIGRKVRFLGFPNLPAEIQGIVSDTHAEALTRHPEPEIYLSYWDSPPFTKHLVIRTSNPNELVSRVRKELRAIDPTVAIENVKTMEQLREDSIAPQIFAMRLLTGFSFVGCALALVGIYGLLGLSIRSRRREIAIRVAIGARRSDILRLVFRDTFRWIALGLILGAAGAIVLGRILENLLYGIEPGDPLTLSCMTAFFLITACLASWAPALRATKIDPVEALKCD